MGKLLHKPSAQKQPNVESYLAEAKLDLVINVRDTHADDGSITDGYTIRRKAVDFSVCLLTDIKLSILIIGAMSRKKVPVIKAWDQFGLISRERFRWLRGQKARGRGSGPCADWAVESGCEC